MTKKAPQEPVDPMEVMTIKQVAVMLKLPLDTVYGMAQRGEIPARKLGKAWRFRRDVVLAWVLVGPEKKVKP